jgi:hypothetical protein
MNKTAKILIASAFAVAIGFASAESWTNVAKTPATVAHQVGPHASFTLAAPVAAQPTVTVQPTEWWIPDSPECALFNDEGYSLVQFYKDAVKFGFDPHLTNKGNMVILEYHQGSLRQQLPLFRSKAACETALQAAKDAAQAEQRKLDQVLAPYR